MNINIVIKPTPRGYAVITVLVLSHFDTKAHYAGIYVSTENTSIIIIGIFI